MTPTSGRRRETTVLVENARAWRREQQGAAPPSVTMIASHENSLGAASRPVHQEGVVICKASKQQRGRQVAPRPREDWPAPACSLAAPGRQQFARYHRVMNWWRRKAIEMARQGRFPRPGSCARRSASPVREQVLGARPLVRYCCTSIYVSLNSTSDTARTNSPGPMPARRWAEARRDRLADGARSCCSAYTAPQTWNGKPSWGCQASRYVCCTASSSRSTGHGKPAIPVRCIRADEHNFRPERDDVHRVAERFATDRSFRCC